MPNSVFSEVRDTGTVMFVHLRAEAAARREKRARDLNMMAGKKRREGVYDELSRLFPDGDHPGTLYKTRQTHNERDKS